MERARTESGWGTRIRTWEWRDQNPLPYRLAIPQLTFFIISFLVRKERLELSRREALEPKSSVSTNSTTPAHKNEVNQLVATAGFEPATPSL